MHILILPYIYKTKDKPLAGIFFREQALALKKAGYQIGVISIRVNSIRKMSWKNFRIFNKVDYENDNGMNTYLWQGWNWFTQKIPVGQSILFTLKGMAIFKKYIKTHGYPDIIHTHSITNVGMLARRIKKRYQIPYVTTEHRTAFAMNKIHPSILKSMKKAFSKADRRIVVSPELGRILEEKVGEQILPWKYIPNIVSDRFFTNKSNRTNKNKFVILNVSFIHERKGHDILIRAFENAFNRHENVELRLGGDGPLKEKLMKYAVQRKIEHKIKFLGMLGRNEVHREMQNCDIFVLSSYYETFGVVVIEALACGKPVISTACGGPEFIVNKKNGILIPPGSINELKNAMIKMYQIYENYNKNEIKRDCYNRFSEKSVLKQLAEVYNEIYKK